MKVALVNPDWDFAGSIYFGCREPHLPLEFGYAAALLARSGHRRRDHRRAGGSLERAALARPGRGLRPGHDGRRPPRRAISSGAAPRPSCGYRKRRSCDAAGIAADDGCRRTARLDDAACCVAQARCRCGRARRMRGSCSSGLANARQRTGRGSRRRAIAARRDCRPGRSAGGRFRPSLPALRWPAATLHDGTAIITTASMLHRGPGAEIEASRGCPYHCSFCAKKEFSRPISPSSAVIDPRRARWPDRAGVGYVYFIDEIFLPWRAAARSARASVRSNSGCRPGSICGSRDMLDLLGAAGCVSIEAGVESLTAEGRDRLDKHCRLSTDELTGALVHRQALASRLSRPT